jgi:hypothetical protein
MQTQPSRPDPDTILRRALELHADDQRQKGRVDERAIVDETLESLGIPKVYAARAEAELTPPAPPAPAPTPRRASTFGSGEVLAIVLALLVVGWTVGLARQIRAFGADLKDGLVAVAEAIDPDPKPEPAARLRDLSLSVEGRVRIDIAPFLEVDVEVNDLLKHF